MGDLRKRCHSCHREYSYMTAGPLSIRRRLRRTCVITVGLLVIYVCSYLILSFTGGYIVSESGEHRIVVAMADVYIWLPYYGICRPFRNARGDHIIQYDLIGFFYCPLILLDQKYIHPTIRFLDNGRYVVPSPAPALEKYHPRIENRWHGRYPYIIADPNNEANVPGTAQ